MTACKKSIIPFIMALFIFVPSGIDASPISLIENYIAALENDDWQKAKNCWHPEMIKRSAALGITLEDIPVKFDCASTLYHSLEAIKAGIIKVDTISCHKYSDYMEIELRLVSSSDTALDKYYAVPFDDEWKLVPRYYVHTHDWNIKQTKFVNIHYNDISLINSHALETLDNFVMELCGLMNIPQSRLGQLERIKIEYYLCNEDEMELLTGYRAHGLTNFQFDAVITRHLPHRHELAHMLINYALEHVPLYTLPLFQEGFAVAEGGRWGKSPSVLIQLGGVLLNQDFADLDSMLTWRGFHNEAGPADITYPVAGAFVNFIIENYGWDNFQQIYLDFSGSVRNLKSLSKQNIKDRISAVCETSWDRIDSSFHIDLERHTSSGLEPGSGNLDLSPFAITESISYSIAVRNDKDKYFFSIKYFCENPDGVILLNLENDNIEDEYRSWMFAEHLPEIEYKGWRYGLVFDAGEVGLYDYYNNRLLAKFVLVFMPDTNYISAGRKEINFRVSRSLLGDNPDWYNMNFISK